MCNDKPLSPSPHGTYPTPDLSASIMHVFKYSFITFSKMSPIIEHINEQLQREHTREASRLAKWVQMGHRKVATFSAHIRGGPGVGGCASSLIPDSSKCYTRVPKTLPVGNAILSL